MTSHMVSIFTLQSSVGSLGVVKHKATPLYAYKFNHDEESTIFSSFLRSMRHMVTAYQHRDIIYSST